MEIDPLTRRWHVLRPLLLALVAGGVVLALVLLLHPPPPGREVLLTRHATATGEAFDGSDVRVARVPEDAVAEDALARGDPLPAAWPGASVGAGTILTASNAGSAASRALSPEERQVVVAVAPEQASVVAPGDVVDVWARPSMCDAQTCAASLLASGVRIVSAVVTGDPSWGPSTTTAAQVALVLRAGEIDRVLAHSGTDTLTLVLHPPGADTQTSGDTP